MADPLLDAVEDYVVRACLPLAQRMVELERRLEGLTLQKGDPGERGVDGKDGAAGERGADGLAGADGKDGAPGARGADGLAGTNGKDGAPGERGADGIAGRDGLPGRDGFPGKDGTPGRDGTHGEDGVGFDDLTAELGDDGRTVVLRFTRGDIVKEFALAFPVPRYSGVWKAGAGALAGDCYTWGGSLWIALVDTKAAPGGGSRDWQLAVKKGADAAQREEV